MDYQKIEMDETFFDWFGYAPQDSHYVKYAETNPSIIAAGHKIDDVFSVFASARALLLNANVQNYGDLFSNDNISRLYAKCLFLTSAVIEYSICLDLSWQVIWSYIQPSSFEYLIKQQYKEIEKDCTRDSVLAQLNCIIAQNSYGIVSAEKLKELLISFDNDPIVLKVRELNNMLKHRGMVHFIGLGSNPNKMLASIDHKSIPILSRPEYKIEDVEDMLFSYHFKFEEYFNNIINQIMPCDYLEMGSAKMPFSDYLHTLFKMHNVYYDKK